MTLADSIHDNSARHSRLEREAVLAILEKHGKQPTRTPLDVDEFKASVMQDIDFYLEEADEPMSREDLMIQMGVSLLTDGLTHLGSELADYALGESHRSTQ